MPSSTVLPPQAVEFLREVWYPSLDRANVNVGVGLNPSGFTDAREGDLSRTYNNPAGKGDVGAPQPQTAVVKGRMGARITTAATTHARGWAEGWWRAAWDPAGFNPGALLDPESVVFVVDFSVACTSPAFVPGTADVTGFWFAPKEVGSLGWTQNCPGGGVNKRGGFGIGLNDDGAGANQWEFITWLDNAAGGAILSRQAIPVADVTDWNTFRFIIVSAASGRPANLTVQANGTTAVDAIPFDDVTLYRPNTLFQSMFGQDSPGWAFGEALADMGGEGWTFTVRWRQGRFTPSGAQIQGA